MNVCKTDINAHVITTTSNKLCLILLAANDPTWLQSPQSEVQLPNSPMQQVFWWSLREQDSYWLEYQMHHYTAAE